MKINDHKLLFVAFLILMTTVPVFSTDMYLPALPQMVQVYEASLTLVNLTLVVFFIVFATSSLIWGTLSDKYGRKPILLISLSAYITASFLCAVAGSIYQLIFFRALQGVGGGAAMAISMAIVKDVFTGKERERMLVYQSSLMAVAPIVAPVAGAEVLRLTSWRGIFVILGVFGALLLLGSLLMREPSVRKVDRSLLKTFGSLKTLVQYPGFAMPLVIFSIAGMPILMFVGSASDIFITGFGLSEQIFSLFFGFNAAMAVIGPFVYILLVRCFASHSLIGFAFFLTAASGLLVFLIGNHGPITFALAAMPGSLGCALSRPPSMNIMLEQGKQDTGAASSLMNFSILTAGCLGMFFVSLDWGNRIYIYGLASLAAGLFSLVFWPLTWKKCDPSKLPENKETAHSASY